MPGRRLDRREALLAGLGAVASLAGCSAEFDTERHSTTTGGNRTADGTGTTAAYGTAGAGGTTAGSQGETGEDDTATDGTSSGDDPADDGTAGPTSDGESPGATGPGTGTGGDLAGHAMYQYDAANTGYSADGSGPSAEPTPSWSATPGGGYVMSTPAIFRGHVIVGGSDGTLATYDSDGEELGSHSLPGRVSGVALDEDTAYCGFASEGSNGVAAIRESERQWTVPAEGQVVGAPTIHDGTVYATEYYGGPVRAIDAETGDVAWETSVEAEVPGVPAVADGSVYVATNDGVFAFAAADGDQEWHYPLGGEEARFVTMAPAVADGAVVFGDDAGYVHAVETDGTERWSKQPGTYTQSSPAVADGTVYLGVTTETDGDLTCTVHAYDVADGSEAWSTEIDAGMVSAPEVAGDTIYLADRSAGVHALAADGGEYLWSWAGTDQQAVDLIPAPAVAGDTVYVGAYDGSVYALRA